MYQGNIAKTARLRVLILKNDKINVNCIKIERIPKHKFSRKG